MTDRDQQLPNKGEIYLDHVGWMVPDIDAASATFERLGFKMTPYSVHGDRDPVTRALVPMGSANKLILLERGYLEILTPVAGVDTPVSQHMRSCIARSVGVHLVAMAVYDAYSEANRISAAGFELQPTVNLRRTIEGQDGGDVEVSFTVIRARFDAVPEARIQVLTHHTPDQVWQPRYVGNALGITHLDEAWFATADPRASAEGFAQFCGRGIEDVGDGQLVIKLDRGVLRFLPHERAGQRLGGARLPPPPQVAAIVMRTSDLNSARAHLSQVGITPMLDQPAEVIIGADWAMGAALILRDPGI